MKSFIEMLTEDLIVESILAEAVDQPEMVKIFKPLEDLHKKLFPNSWVSVYFVDPNLKIAKSVVLFRSTLKDQWSGGLKENDPQDSIFTIQCLSDDKYQAELVKGKNIRTKKSFTSNKTPFRKVTGDAATVIKKISEWEEKRKKLVDSLGDQV